MTIKPFKVVHEAPKFVIIEMFGGDNNLSLYVKEDLTEMQLGVQGADVAVLALTDEYEAAAQVLEVSGRHGLRVVEPLGEIDTGDPVVLSNFLARALITYPASTRIAIGFWDHGSGVFDETDLLARARALRWARLPRWARSRSLPARRLFFSTERLVGDMHLRAMLHDDQSGGLLTNREAGEMLKSAFADAGRSAPVDLIFSDTCLNGMVEVASEFAAYADVIVASEELEPGDGWDYYEWLSRLGASPPPDAEAWGRQAVEAMEAGYLSRPAEHPVTLSAVVARNGITTAFAHLVHTASAAGRDGFRHLDWARSQSQQFASGYDSYDLLDFVRRLAGADEQPAIAAAAAAVAEAVSQAIVHSVALGSTVPNAHGLAFWFPSARGSFLKDRATYRELAFDQAAGWSGYLDTWR